MAYGSLNSLIIGIVRFLFEKREDIRQRVIIKRSCHISATAPLETADILGIQVGESRNQVKRYLRLTELIPELLDLVDQKRFPIIVGVEVSFFTRKIQGWIHEYCMDVRIPKWNEMAELRSSVPQKDITKENLYEYLNGKKGIPDPPGKIILTQRRLNKYFPKYMSTPERERIIVSLLEKWKEEQESSK